MADADARCQMAAPIYNQLTTDNQQSTMDAGPGLTRIWSLYNMQHVTHLRVHAHARARISYIHSVYISTPADEKLRTKKNIFWKKSIINVGITLDEFRWRF
jgi:hypothetical protein